MNTFTSLVLTQLTVPPGNLLYYTILAFATGGALLSAFFNGRTSRDNRSNRIITGLAALLLAQAVVFIISILGWQGWIEPEVILPPIDRAMLLFSVLIICWMFAFPEPQRNADRVVILLGLAVVIGAVVSCFTWQSTLESNPATTTFSGFYSYNQSVDNRSWQVLSILGTLVGIVVLHMRKQTGMWNGIILLAMGFLGHVGSLILPTAGDYSGLIRLAYMAAFPFLLTLPQRLIQIPEQHVVPLLPDPDIRRESALPLSPHRLHGIDAATFEALLSLATENELPIKWQAITHAVAKALQADYCFSICLIEAESLLNISGGYDLVNEKPINPTVLKKNAAKILANALKSGHSLRISANTAVDAKGLAEALGLNRLGHLLFTSIPSSEKGSLGGLLLLSPNSDRAWSINDQAYLTSVAAALAPIVGNKQEVATVAVEAAQVAAPLEKEEPTPSEEKSSGEDAAKIESLESSLKQAEQTINTLQAEKTALQAEMDEKIKKLSEQHEHEANEKLQAMEAEARQAVQLLQDENAALRSELEFQSDSMLKQLESEKAELQTGHEVEANRLNEQLQEKEQAIEHLMKENSELRLEIKIQTSSLVKQMELKNTLLVSSEESQRTMQQLQAENEKIRAELEIQTATMMKQVEIRNSFLSAHEELQHNIRNLQIRNTELESEMESQALKMEQRERELLATHQEMQYAIQQMEQENSQLQSELELQSSALVKQVELKNSVISRQEEAQNSIQQLQNKIEELQLEMELQSATLIKQMEIKNSLVSSREDLERTIEELQNRIAEMRLEMEMKATTSSRALEKELKAAVQEKAHLQNQLSDLKMEMQRLEMNQRAAPGNMVLVQNLHEPLSSISGYADLLLGDSLGSMGSLQRKYVERIKASTEQMGMMLNERPKVAAMDKSGRATVAPRLTSMPIRAKTASMELKLEALDLLSVAETAVARTSGQVRGKKIMLELSLPRKLPAINSNQEAAQKLLESLLQNAITVSPEGGVISLKIQKKVEAEREYALIQVGDSGGGIAENDISYLLERTQHGGNTPMRGAASDGAELKSVKELVDAHQGRMAIESHEGKGATINIMLPIAKANSGGNER